MTNQLHLAQVNIARMKGPLESPVMAGFVARLDKINALADGSPGFVWRLQTGEGNATYLRPYDDDRILFNLSVWESIEHLREYVYRSAHVEVLRNRHEWFSKFEVRSFISGALVGPRRSSPVRRRGEEAARVSC
jgi:heme-degrading monooxygenase HmoA